jgi:hypothetical protein
MSWFLTGEVPVFLYDHIQHQVSYFYKKIKVSMEKKYDWSFKISLLFFLSFFPNLTARSD